MRLNREQLAFVLAALVLCVALVSLVRSLTAPPRYPAIPEGRRGVVLEVSVREADLHLADPGGRRDPFGSESQWHRLRPAPLLPPPVAGVSRPRIGFGLGARRPDARALPFEGTADGRRRGESP